MNITLQQDRFRGIIDDLPEVSIAAPQRPATLSRAIVVQMFGLVLASILLAVALIRFSSQLETLGPWGYAGVAAAEFGNSAMLIFPTPAAAYTFAMGAVLNPIAVGLIGGVFATLGELIGYYLGRRGSTVLSSQPVVQRLSAWTEKWGAFALFGFAALPVPFDIAGVWAGTARYPLIRFIPIVLMGKVIKITSIAVAGYFGLEALVGISG